jgi:cytochrome P450 family 28
VDVVSNSIYAVDAESFTSDKAVIREMGRKIMTSSTMVNIYIMLISVFPMIKHIYKMRFVSPEIERFFTKLTSDALEYRKANQSDRVDFLEYLGQLKEKKNLTNLDTGK